MHTDNSNETILSLISMDMYPLYSHDPESQLFLCIRYVFLLWVQMLLSLAITLITPLHCSIQLVTDYSPFRLATLCLINCANESPFRLAIHSCYTDSSQLSLISDNYTLAWLYQWKSQLYSSLTLSMKVPTLLFINFINESPMQWIICAQWLHTVANSNISRQWNISNSWTLNKFHNSRCNSFTPELSILNCPILWISERKTLLIRNVQMLNTK